MIRPVENQGVIQRAQDISQIKHNENMKPQHDQNNIYTHIQKEAVHNREQVVKYNNSDGKENKFDAKEKGNGMYHNQKKRKKNNKKEADTNSSQKKRVHIDIKI